MVVDPRIVSQVVLLACLVGCGTSTLPTSSSSIPNPVASVPIPAVSGDPYNSAQYPTPGTPPASASMPTPVPVPSLPAGASSSSPSPGNSPSNGSVGVLPTPSPSPTPVVVNSPTALRIVNIQPTEHLSLCNYIVPCWKAAINSISVQNPRLDATQSGQLIISFLLNGSVAEQPITVNLSISPAGIWTNSTPFAATVRSDTANAQVVTYAP